MRASNIVSNIAGIPQFQSLKPSQKIAVGVVSISFAVTIIGLPFAPFVYRGLVEVLKRYNKSTKEDSKFTKVREKRFEGKVRTAKKTETEKRDADTKKSRIKERKVRDVKTEKRDPDIKSSGTVEVKGVQAEEVENLSPEKVLEKRLNEEGFTTGKFPGTGSAPMPAKGVALQKYALQVYEGYRIYFATDTGYASPHLNIFLANIKIDGEEYLKRTFGLLDFMIKRKQVIESQGFIYTNNPPPREKGQFLKLASDHSDFFIQDGDQVRSFDVVLKYIGDEGEVSYTLKDNDFELAIRTLDRNWEKLKR